MFCTNCGKEIPAGKDGAAIRFCPYCGGKVIELPPEPVTKAAAEAVNEAEAAVEVAAAEAVNEVETTAEEVAKEVETAVEEVAAEAAEAAGAAQEAASEVVNEAETAAEGIAAEEPAPAIEAAAEDNLTETQPEPEAPKKKSKAPIVALIAVIVLAAAGYFIYQNLPSTKISKLMKEASALSASAQFDEAVGKLDEALAIDPQKTEVLTAKADTYIAKAQSIFAGGDYKSALRSYADALDAVSDLDDSAAAGVLKHISEGFSSMAAAMFEKGSFSDALGILNDKNTLFPAETEATAQEILNIYKTWADKVIESKDAKKASELASIIDDVRSDAELASVKSELLNTSISLTSMKYHVQLADFGKTLKKYIDAGNVIGACDELYNNMLKRFSSNYNMLNWLTMRPDDLPFISDIDANTKIGIYKASDTYIIYLGGYDASGKRSGEGTWLTCMGTPTSDFKKYCAMGTWKNDLPNGQFTITNYSKKSTDDGFTRVTKVGAVNGLYDGTAEYVAENGSTYRPTFNNGHPVIIEDYEMNDTVYHIASYSDDEMSFYHFTRGSDAIEGIFGFTD